MLPRILIITTLFLFSAFADEAEYKKTGKGPLKVFIMAGQSNMQGHGLSEHIRMAASDASTKAEFGPLMDNGNFVVRKDVWIVYGNRKGGLSVGYGASGNKVGPEIGFGRYIGDYLKEQVLLIKTCWGGHSLKEKFLPPSMGGPGPSYKEMVSQVKNTLENLKNLFPEYDAKKGYEIVGLVWHQAWNDMIDREQRSENPPYKTYTERQAALLRDLRAEFKTPEMLMVIGECGVDGGTTESNSFRVAQRATTLMKELKKTTRFVPTGQFWDPDERFKSNGGYHYNGNGKIYYYKGKAMAEAMYDLMPKIRFEDLGTMLDAQSKPVYNAIRFEKYAQASQQLTVFKNYLDEQKSVLETKEYAKLESIYELLNDKINEIVDPALAAIKELRKNKDYYGITQKYSSYAKILRGIAEFDLLTESLKQEIKDPQIMKELKLGRTFYDYISRIKKSEERYKGPRKEILSDRYKRYLESKIFQNYPDSLYAKAAMKASAELQKPENPVLNPEEYVSMVVNE